VATKLAKEKAAKVESRIKQAEERRMLQAEQAKPMARTDPTARIIASGAPESVVAQKVMERVETLRKWIRGEATLDKVVELEGTYSGSSDSDEADSRVESDAGESVKDVDERMDESTDWPEWHGIELSAKTDKIDNKVESVGAKEQVLNFVGTTVTVMEDVGVDEWWQQDIPQAKKPSLTAAPQQASAKSKTANKKTKRSLTRGKVKKGSWSRDRKKASNASRRK